MIQSPVMVKAFQVREARLSLNETHCMIRSPFITAASPKETLERLEIFSEEIKDALTSLASVCEKPLPVDTNREKSVDALVDQLSRKTSTGDVDGQLNKAFLQSAGMVQTALITLENEIVHQKRVPVETVDKAISHLTTLGLFVDAVPQIYQRNL